MEENPDRTSCKSGRITPLKMPLLEKKQWKLSSSKQFLLEKTVHVLRVTSQDLPVQIKGIMKEITDMTKKKRGESFQDTDLEEIQELMGTTPEELADDLVETSASKPVPGDEGEDVEAVPEDKSTN